MRVGFAQPIAQPICASAPFGVRSLATLTRGEGEQRKSLVVEIETGIQDRPIRRDQQNDRAILRDEIAAEILQRPERGLAPWSTPAQASRFAIGMSLARGHPTAPGQQHRRSVEIDLLVKAALDVVRPPYPPERQHGIEQPGAQGFDPVGDVGQEFSLCR